jgi:hypothetical protein
VTLPDPAPGRSFFGALLMAIVLAGCTATPQASPERDAEAKNFGTHPGYSTLYIYRAEPEGNAEWQETVIYINERLIGSTLPQTFYRVHLQPGTYALSGIAGDQGRFKLETRPDEPYFIELRVTDGASRYRLVEAEAGKRTIRECCTLLESWAPGQRPLLR